MTYRVVHLILSKDRDIAPRLLLSRLVEAVNRLVEAVNRLMEAVSRLVEAVGRLVEARRVVILNSKTNTRILIAVDGHRVTVVGVSTFV